MMAKEDIPILLEGVDDRWLGYFKQCVDEEWNKRLSRDYASLEA